MTNMMKKRSYLLKKGLIERLTMDITIQKGRSLPKIKKCTDCCSNFHCPFCGPKWFKSTKPSKVHIHLQTHFNRAVEHEGYTIHRCHRNCRTQGHYHCLYCDKTVIRKEDIIRHVDICNCKKEMERSTTLSTKTQANTATTKRRATSGTPATVPTLASLATAAIPGAATGDAAESNKPAVGMDITIRKGRSLPEIKRCTDCCSNFHCPFCGPQFFKSTRLCKVQIHLQTHFNRAVEHDGYTIHRCGRSCRTYFHYHCLYCNKTLRHKEAFLRHLNVNCKKQTKRATTTRSSSTTDTGHHSYCITKTRATSTKAGTKRKVTPTVSATTDTAATVMPTTTDTSATETAPATDHTEETDTTPTPDTLDTTASTGPATGMDITIQKGRSLPEIKKCSDCCSLFHCPFCGPKLFKSTKLCRVQIHLQIHFKRSVEHEGYTIHRCGRGCRTRWHYHCMYCTKTVITKRDFIRHLQVCNQPPSTEESPSAKKIRICKGQYPLQKCPDCHLTIYRKNFKLHIKRKHTAKQVNVTPFSYFKSECLDQMNGLYAVHRSFRGAPVPIHAQLKLWGERQLACDSSECQSHMEIAWNSGQDSYQCSHIKSLSYCKTFLTSPSLKPELLPEVVKRKLFRKEKMRACVDRQILAQEQNVPLSIESEIATPASKKFISVYEPVVSFYSRLGRIMVSYDSIKRYWYCPCTRKKKSCIHLCIAKWHLFQMRPQLFKRVPRVRKSKKDEFQVSAVEGMGAVAEAVEVCSFSQSHSTIDETESCLLFIPTIGDFTDTMNLRTSN